ncbi:carbon catabolite repressor protein 4 homolog 6 isoform X2 [Mercurialis annua]|uniref:carbon catabolite repressor protein 4 homolog 6 isoform X2 n=1 Tax=Mercurialis annua TaxID=3986 RepID=UPI00215E299E|nr:carbon catabolite repressor protein 4 homolog 6 isoform X2 [Mercurialis annua]
MKFYSATSTRQFLATAASMSSPSPYQGGGRNQWRRGFSGLRQYSGGGRDSQFVTGESHFGSVHDANLGIRQAAARPQSQQPPHPGYNPNQQFRRPPPPYVYRPSPPPFYQNQGFQRPSHQQFRPKPLDYRDWEYAKTQPHPGSEKFVVLSYNILADYLAITHRKNLYFHIPVYMMEWEWRKKNILFELNLWSPDIMCFQEVDKFQDLADQLKLRGYTGIWQMRTGNAVDGCAIFWRASRFKLIHEESIEFNKLGLRDNVAQICVLELMSKNCTSNTSGPCTSSAGSEKVVVCNVHVLYNPRRGEIKLGQVRTLLDRSYVVSKRWNAPVVLCGDFNCTPKSPLYNFIAEQKLDLSGIDRDKVSGQASAEIRFPNPNSNPNPDPRSHSSNNSNQASLIENNKLEEPLPDMQRQIIPEKNDENISFINDCSQPHVIRTIPALSDKSCAAGGSGNNSSSICIKETETTQEDVIDSHKEGTKSTVSVLSDSFEGNLSISRSENELFHKSTATETSRGEVASLENSEYISSQSIVNNEIIDLIPTCQTNISSRSVSLYHIGDDKLEDQSRQELNDFDLEGGMTGEDQSAFLSALHDKEDSFQTVFTEGGQSELIHSQNELDPITNEVHSPSTEVINDASLDLDSEAFTVEKTAYNPSMWTPMEMATATGNTDCTFLEHPLKLKSTYTEVEGRTGTRDLNGEPSVTSYNRRFLGTVDYIWSSEGLQTTRVLAPIPKHAMQWTPGFPTRKWGSDHIALASELVFTKDATDRNSEVQKA